MQQYGEELRRLLEKKLKREAMLAKMATETATEALQRVGPSRPAAEPSAAPIAAPAPAPVPAVCIVERVVEVEKLVESVRVVERERIVERPVVVERVVMAPAPDLRVLVAEAIEKMDVEELAAALQARLEPGTRPGVPNSYRMSSLAETRSNHGQAVSLGVLYAIEEPTHDADGETDATTCPCTTDEEHLAHAGGNHAA